MKSGIGMHADKGILGKMHGTRSDRERVHWNAELVDIGMDDLHKAGKVATFSKRVCRARLIYNQITD